MNQNNELSAIIKRLDKIEMMGIAIKNMLTNYVNEEFTTEEAALYLSIKKKTVHNLRSSGKLQGRKKGNRRVYTRSELDEYLTSLNNEQ